MATLDFHGTRRDVLGAAPALKERFGEERLEETGLPVYANPVPPASYLGWSRIRHAQRMLDGASATRAALDFGPGLGVMLPFLVERFDLVVACDEDPEVTGFMTEQLGLDGVDVTNTVPPLEHGGSYDAVLALDVLEHVDDLDGLFETLLSVTAENGVWVISGPTENVIYRMMRKVARTRGEGHARRIYEVFDAIPTAMRREKVQRLPFGLPLFLIGRFRRV